ncbi:multidrug resistance-associated protein 9, partial [Prunus dulcis]
VLLLPKVLTFSPAEDSPHLSKLTLSKKAHQQSTPNCTGCEAGGKKCMLTNNDTRVESAAMKLAATSATLGKRESIKNSKISRGSQGLESSNQVDIPMQFTDKLGEAAYGTDYKGKLSSEIFVAVKVLNGSNGKGEEFINEVGTMGHIHHVNVVRLVGFCTDGFRRALVYEFFSNGSMQVYISSVGNKNGFFCWDKLQDIAIGIARGIEYLHQGYHNFTPKISDFDLAKLCSKDQSTVSMTTARGTMSYIAPEVFSKNFGNVSYKSDVYSFGMLLLEMVGGRTNVNRSCDFLNPLSHVAGTAELRTPVFNGENYEFWSIKMKAILKSHGLWDLVENGLDNSDLKKEKEEVTLFPRIVNEETSKGAWDILKLEFRGDKQVRNVKLQGLRREFEYTRMKDSESLFVYLVRLFDMMNQMKSYGAELPRERVVQKLLFSLPKSYDSFCSVIEHSKDLETLEVQEVVAFLKSFELRLDRHTENSTERAFTSLNIEEKNSKSGSFPGDQKSQKSWKSNDENKTACKHYDKLHYGKCWFEGKPKCHGCGKFRHMIRDCNGNKNVHKVNYANQVEGTVLCSMKRDSCDKTKLGKKHIQEVMLVPGLEENLLSVGQMMEHGYYLVFGGNMLTIAFFPQQNEVAERKNRTVVEMAKSMLHEKVYLLNRCPTKSLKKVTPFEAYTGRKPGIAHLKIFGSPCHVLIPSALRHKLEENSHKCIFVGYGLCEKGYMLFDPSTRKVIMSRDVQFDENGSWKWENASAGEMTVPVPTENQNWNPSQSLDTQMQMDEGITLQNEPSQSLDTPTQMDEGFNLQDEGISESSQAIDHTPKKWRSVNEIMAQCNMCIVEPDSFEEADLDE